MSSTKPGLSCTVVLLLVFLPVFIVGPAWANWQVEDAVGRTVTIPDTPNRIFSGGLNITSTVVKLAAETRLAAVGQFASDTRYSFVANDVQDASTYQQVRPEIVLSYDPDLVLLTPFTPSKIRERIIGLDVPVIVTHEVRGPGDVRRNVRLIGRAIARPKRAHRINNDLKTVAQNGSSSSITSDPTILYYPNSGVVPGRGTMPNWIMNRAGVINIASRAGLSGWSSISPETIVKRDPDWIVVDQINQSATVQRLRDDSVLSELSAIRNNRIKAFLPKFLTVAGPHYPRAIRYWQSQFHRARLSE